MVKSEMKRFLRYFLNKRDSALYEFKRSTSGKKAMLVGAGLKIECMLVIALQLFGSYIDVVISPPHFFTDLVKDVSVRTPFLNETDEQSDYESAEEFDESDSETTVVMVVFNLYTAKFKYI